MVVASRIQKIIAEAKKIEKNLQKEIF